MKREEQLRIKKQLESQRDLFTLNELAESEWDYLLEKAKTEALREEPRSFLPSFSFAQPKENPLFSYQLSLALAALLMLLGAVFFFTYTYTKAEMHEKYYQESEVPKEEPHKLGIWVDQIADEGESDAKPVYATFKSDPMFHGVNYNRNIRKISSFPNRKLDI